MPNWCKGNMRIKGNKECIKKFLLEGLQEVIDILGNTRKVELNEYNHINYTRLHIKNTMRGFVEGIDENINLDQYCDENQVCTFVLNVGFAWDVNAKQIQGICKKYHFDTRLYLFERGMEFNRDIEVIDEKITKDNTIKYDNYLWDCIMPNIGG